MLRASKTVFPSEETHTQLVIQHQMASSENIHTSNIIQTKQVVFRDIYVYYINAYICIQYTHSYIVCIFIKQQLMKKEVLDLKERKRELHGKVWKEESEGG